MNIKKIVVIAYLLCVAVKGYSQKIQKDVVESDGVTNNIVATQTGMYDGSISEKAKTYFDKAYSYADKEDYKNAEKFYLKAIKTDKKFVEAYDNLGRVYRRIGNLNKAEEYYKKSIKLYPKGIMAHQNLAVVYSLRKDYKNSAKEYNKIVEISPENPEGYFGLANAYMMQSNFDEALINSKKALEIYKKTNSLHLADGYHLTGLIEYYRKNKEEAKSYLLQAKEKGARIDPNIEKQLFSDKESETVTTENEKIIAAYNWLLETPLGKEPEKRKSINAFLLKWMTETPKVSIELSQKMVPYMECNECLVVFMGGWAKYELESSSTNKVRANLMGLENVIKFYQKNKSKIGVNKDIEKFIKLKNNNKLEDYIKKNI